MYRGRLGFRKNKSDEKRSALPLCYAKNPETEEDLLEHRTDGTDAFDTLYIGAEKFFKYEAAKPSAHSMTHILLTQVEFHNLNLVN